MGKDQLPKDGWFDVSTPFWYRHHCHQQNRFSAYDRLIRPQAAALRLYRTGWMELRGRMLAM